MLVASCFCAVPEFHYHLECRPLSASPGTS